MDELLEFREQFLNRIKLAAESHLSAEEEKFFEDISESLSEAGILDNVEYSPYRNSNKGLKIDGYSWNDLEKSLTGIITDYEGLDEISTINKADILKLSKKVERFLDKVEDKSFLDELEESTDRVIATSMAYFLPDAIKCRVVILTDKKLSDRVKKIEIEDIKGLPTSIEIWDIERIRILNDSGTENEPFTVDFMELCKGLSVLPANINPEDTSTYLCVVPGEVLSKLYDEYGQRLLEANVRTFLDFRSSVNNGIRKALLTEPENFFSYNNGLTCTATGIKTEVIDGREVITSLDDLQIVNGGQTTASIYFSPREKGGIGELRYKDIDLSKVFVQMKLTVITEEEKREILKSKISQYANTQNAIQKSDLVSNHPFHLNLEKLALTIPMPAGESGLSTKWFYERARGQYGTRIRALSSAKRNQFELEFPKNQKFNKTDMAKFENTWRMNPHEVKKGAQANLRLLGAKIADEYDKDDSSFKHAFYRELIAKAILFKSADSAILKSDWYKEEKGFKAETVTFTLALLRHLLIKDGKDINLERIFKNQSVSSSLLDEIVSLAKFVREKILDPNFRQGVGNPSEFCKSEKGWNLVKKLDYDLSLINRADYVDAEQKREAEHKNDEINEAGAQIESQTSVMEVTADEWLAIKEFFKNMGYPIDHKNVALPEKCSFISSGKWFPSERESKVVMDVRKQAYLNGFDFV
ncbi:AIPR family protein [Methylophaga sp. OBS1]|uniref:AIPR family protein n=1 Tax=Methylophaga sp. OBS1 TaxID=2991933 RepID=UPI00224EC7F0|nr:AIPR family protein [Methylophaga sp. OBS1]MCX4191016.1 AIPR family protein [Methylophaga sp. OBS1]MCX4192038.1 AIPR family protein [Methylophaga sp. OBS1]